MRIAYWDCFSGIAGDMSLGALVGCGLSVDDLRRDLAGLALEGFTIEHRRVQRGALAADKIDVVIEGVAAGGSATFDDGAHGHGHGRAGSDGSDPHGHPAHPHRGLAELRGILAASTLPAGVVERADRVFEALCAAEAAVHGVGIDEVHLHEVGAVDAIVDIVGTCCGLRRLGIEAIRCSPLNLGAGRVRTAHGELPVPAPATAQLLRDAPVYARGPELELVTPTGAALVATLAEGFGPWPAMKLAAVGYGAGDHDFEGFPNVLRLVIGDSIGHAELAAAAGTEKAPAAGALVAGAGGGTLSAATVQVIETNLDDASPEIIGALVPKLLAAGALDAFTTPVFMKKNRPGTQLTVLSPAHRVELLADMVLRETTTLGVRIHPVQRRELARRHVTVGTPWGRVRVKVGAMGDEVVNWAPEFDDCERLARDAGVPVKRILQVSAAAYARGTGVVQDDNEPDDGSET
jgi:hypothetical protein